MNSHELANLLLALDDGPVVILDRATGMYLTSAEIIEGDHPLLDSNGNVLIKVVRLSELS